jgi:hypothetical protein
VRWIAITIAVGLATPAMASPSEADRLFAEGRELAGHGDYAGACERFAKSFELDRGRGIESNLADCNEHLGHVALAWHLFRHVADEAERAGDTKWLRLAQTRLSELAKRVGTLSIRVAEPAPPGLAIALDGRALIPGPAIREVVDPGRVEVIATAPGYERFSRVSMIGAGETTIVNVELAAVAITAGTPERRRSRVKLAYAAGGVAIAAAITGVALAIDARLRYDSVTGDRAHCDPGPVCDAIGQHGIDRSQTIGNVGTGFAIGAAVMAAVAAVVYLTAPRDAVVTPSGIAFRF